MAVCDFYALGGDLRRLFDFLFAETDVVAYELSSLPERDVRQFRSVAEIDDAFSLGAPRAGRLQLWSATVSKPPIVERVAIARPAPTSRYSVEGAGLIQLYLDGEHDGFIHHTHYGHWNEAGARARSVHPAGDCDWPALRRLSRRIQSHIKGTLAVATLHGRPVLADAGRAVHEGRTLWYNGVGHGGDSPDLLPATPRA